MLGNSNQAKCQASLERIMSEVIYYVAVVSEC